ncbi:MAG: hypothetical protein ACRC1W_01325 [Shewanella sp.]
MSLGLVATGKRSIRSGSQYDRYFNAMVEGNEVELIADGDVFDTLKQMKKIVNKTLLQTKSISKLLKGSTPEATCRNVWEFLYHHVQYTKDHPLREQLRTPARMWKDRATGVDCDCYSVFISSVLANLGIVHSFRMAGYDGEYQHVYVVVPKNGKSTSDRGSYYVIDPVVNQFNYEAPFSKKHDHKMSQVTMLNGFGECNTKPVIDRLRKFVPTQEVIDRGGIPTREFLEDNGITYAPSFNNQSEKAVYVVNTPEGLLSLPTVLAPSQAEQVKSMVGPCATTTNTQADKPAAASIISDDMIAKAKKNWLWILAIGAGTWILLTGGDQEEVKSGLNGLSGRKFSKKKKALKPISI